MDEVRSSVRESARAISRRAWRLDEDVAGMPERYDKMYGFTACTTEMEDAGKDRTGTGQRAGRKAVAGDADRVTSDP